MKSLVLAIDFDGTITEESFPAVGEIRKGSKKYITKLYNDGHKIIINTCRSGKYEGFAQDFLNSNDIPYHLINSNLPELIDAYSQDCRKISADIYIDNKCVAGLPSWKKIYKIIKKESNK